MREEVEHYILSCPPARRARLEQIHGMILDLLPEAEVDMKYRMPTYRVGEGWVAVANQKHYISVYTCGYHHIERFKAKHPSIRIGKGCINLRDRDDIPYEDLKQVVAHAIGRPKLE